MFNLIKRFSRFLGILGLMFFLLLEGVMIVEHGLDGVGSLFIIGALLVGVYGVSTWLLKQFKRIKFTDEWRMKESWKGFFLVGILSQIGIVESLFTQPEFIFLFIFLFVFTLLACLNKFRKQQIKTQGFSDINGNRLKKIAFGAFVVLGGLSIISLENHGHQELAPMLAVLYLSLIHI